jgi:hypothetical protein
MQDLVQDPSSKITAEDICIITPYLAMNKQVQALLDRQTEINDIVVNTTDSFQKRQKSLIMLILMMNQISKPDHTASPERLNVRITRHTNTLWVIEGIECAGKASQDVTITDEGVYENVQPRKLMEVLRWFGKSGRVSTFTERRGGAACAVPRQGVIGRGAGVFGHGTNAGVSQGQQGARGRGGGFALRPKPIGTGGVERPATVDGARGRTAGRSVVAPPQDGAGISGAGTSLAAGQGVGAGHDDDGSGAGGSCAISMVLKLEQVALVPSLLPVCAMRPADRVDMATAAEDVSAAAKLSGRLGGENPISSSFINYRN